MSEDEINVEKAEHPEVTKMKSDCFKVAKKVEKAGEKDLKEHVVSVEKEEKKEAKKKNVVQWQCKYRRYQIIVNIIDKMAEKLNSGKDVMKAIKARNWRIVLDLDDKDDLAIHKELLASEQCGNEFMLLKESDKCKSDLPERGATLAKLWDMPDDQLLGMLDDEEIEQAGLIPGVMPNRQELILAIIDAKKLTGGNV